MGTFRLIQDGLRGGVFNMAADLFLVEQTVRTGEPVLRLYGWIQPTLSLGFHQKVRTEVSRRCRELGIPIVRRPTGGRAVLHDRELTYCFVAPSAHTILREGRNALLRSIGVAFVDAARCSGLDAELVRAADSKPGSSARRRDDFLCFSSSSRWEVQLNGCKWIGSAQRILKDAFLQHGSIMLGAGSIPSGAFASEDIKFGFNECDATLLERSLRQTIPEAFQRMLNASW